MLILCLRKRPEEVDHISYSSLSDFIKYITPLLAQQ
jgi:hypothetical protein